jgi:hypothetical protein
MILLLLLLNWFADFLWFLKENYKKSSIKKANYFIQYKYKYLKTRCFACRFECEVCILNKKNLHKTIWILAS